MLEKSGSECRNQQGRAMTSVRLRRKMRNRADLCILRHHTASILIVQLKCALISLADPQKKRLAEFFCPRASEWTNLAGGAAGRGGEDD